MSNHRRMAVQGGTYFFTVRLADRHDDLLVREVALLRHVTGLARKRWPFVIEHAVVLPQLTHMIWTLPPEDADFSKRWRLIKSTFSRHVPASNEGSPSMAARGEKGIWRRRFWEHRIRGRDDLATHQHLILTAPVQAGLVAKPEDWPYSSIHHRSMTAPSRVGHSERFVSAA